ncbi:MAG: hypothetical protein RIS94_1046 [Pseudomonadota bacterium]
MRRHAPMWEAELGDGDGINDIDVYLRKSMDDMEDMSRPIDGARRPNWSQLLIFLGAAAIFLFIASFWTAGT